MKLTTGPTGCVLVPRPVIMLNLMPQQMSPLKKTKTEKKDDIVLNAQKPIFVC
jgi:hypothetical protein